MKKYYIISSIVAACLFLVGIIGLTLTGTEYIKDGVNIDNGLSFFDSSFSINGEELVSDKIEIIKEVEIIDNKIDFNINVSNAKLEIKSGDTERAVIRTYTLSNNEFVINDEVGKVTIKNNESNNGWLNMNINDSSSIEIIVPEDIISSYDIVTSNGAIEVSDVNVEYIDMNTSNAVFDLDNIKATENIELKTSNGRVSVEEIESKNIVIETSNGLVNLEEIKGDEIDVKTSNGGIKAEDCYALKVSLKTSNGSLSLDNDEEYIIEDLYTHTTNGKETINAKYNNRN